VRTARTECLDWILVRSERHLRQVLTTYLEHYNTARPHRGNHLDVPVPPAEHNSRDNTPRKIERVDVLGGLIHQYQYAA
jgi:putative transposase